MIGQEAKFKKIKVDYYSGKFNWAKAQLDILKQSTSKLISNNSIELSLLISNNLNLDTTQIPLQLFAEGELLLFQNKYNEALKKFNTIEEIYLITAYKMIFYCIKHLLKSRKITMI